MKIAEFVARNGPAFELMLKENHKDNPKYGFLYEGELHQYYVEQVEKARQGTITTCS